MSQSVYDQLCGMAAEARPIVHSASAPGNPPGPPRTEYIVVVAGAVFTERRELAERIALEINQALNGARLGLKQRGALEGA